MTKPKEENKGSPLRLTEQKLVELIREEWGKRLLQVEKSLETFMKIDSSKKGIISPDTKVRHKGSQLLYTVHEVLPDEIVLRTPEGKLFSVDEEEFSKEYSLD